MLDYAGMMYPMYRFGDRVIVVGGAEACVGSGTSFECNYSGRGATTTTVRGAEVHEADGIVVDPRVGAVGRFDGRIDTWSLSRSIVGGAWFGVSGDGLVDPRG